MINRKSESSSQDDLLKTFWKGNRRLPKFIKALVTYPAPQIEDVEKALSAALEEVGFIDSIRLNQKIAIAVGSRGISHLQILVRLLVEKIHEAGGCPFIVPAMGSHGQSTGKGQRAILRSLGITRTGVHAPIRSSMGVKYLGRTDRGVPVYIDRNAYEADSIIIINRVREHTDFEGPIQSGLMKMLAIGLGKAYGASAIHERGAGEMHMHIPAVARHILQNAPISLGIAVVENAEDNLAAIRCVVPEHFEIADKELLSLARKWTPRLPVENLDVLVVCRLGKEISGTGMDTKTVGRIRIPGVPEPMHPKISRIVVLDLTPASHGNATGLYLADITTQKLIKKIDFQAFYLNQLTAVHLEGGKVPMALKDDREAIEVAMCLGWMYNSKSLRSIVIQDTKHLRNILLSECLVPELEQLENITIQGELFDLAFDLNGNFMIP